MDRTGTEKKRGVALIMVIGVLSVIAVVATSFAVSMRIEVQAARNALDLVRAQYLAEAGVQRALIDLRLDAKARFAYRDTNITTAYPVTLTGGRIESVSIEDEQRKADLNTVPQMMIENLMTLTGIGDETTKAAALIAARPFDTLDQIKPVLIAAGFSAGVVQSDFEALEPFTTVTAFVDSRCSRAPVNVNTASATVLGALFDGIGDGVTTSISATEANTIATALIANRPYGTTNTTGWTKFDSVIDAIGTLSTAQKTLIKANCNPSLTEPAVNTTELCFHGGGVFTIQATGVATASAGTDVATRIVKVIARVYDVWTETTKAEFQDGLFTATTNMDSCPVESNADQGLNYAAGYRQIAGAVKMGFWDNFDEDSAWSLAQWNALNSGGGVTKQIVDIDGDGDKELTSTGTGWPDFRLAGQTGQTVWTFGVPFSMRVYNEDKFDPLPFGAREGWQDIGSVEFHNSSNWWSMNKVYISYWAWRWIESPPGSGNWQKEEIDGVYGIIDDNDREDVMIRTCLWGGNPPSGSGNHYAFIADDFPVQLPNYTVYPDRKTFKVITRGIGRMDVSYLALDTTGFKFMGHPPNEKGTKLYSWPSDATGGWMIPTWSFALCGNKVQPVWDDLRIIPSSGTYQSSTLTPGGTIEAGAAYGTVTIPVSAASEPGTVTLTVTTPTTTTLRYTAAFARHVNDTDCSETPVLEDVSVLYLSQADILYWRDLTE